MDGTDILNRLRKESWNSDTEHRLASHPYVAAAQAGKLTLKQRRAFVIEQCAIQFSDAVSFAALAGHNVGFLTSSKKTRLVDATVPEPVRPPPKGTDVDLFQFLLGGEIYAARLLLNYARKVGLDEADVSNKQRKLMAKSQAYPSYWARLALSNNRAAGAAACAINFPAWGQMCGRLGRALADNADVYGYDDGEDDDGLAFVNFFAATIDDLDNMAIAILDEELKGAEESSYDEIAEHVRLLQEYEVMFWDAIYDGE